MKALYEAVSGPMNEDRTCFKAVFLPDARLMPLVKDKDTGRVAPHIMTVQDWVDRIAKRGPENFFEKQVKGTTETWGDEAHVWSTYESFHEQGGEAFARGINSVQAIFDGKNWKIISIQWQAETPEQRVPKKYLP